MSPVEWETGKVQAFQKIEDRLYYKERPDREMTSQWNGWHALRTHQVLAFSTQEKARCGKVHLKSRCFGQRSQKLYGQPVLSSQWVLLSWKMLSKNYGGALERWSSRIKRTGCFPRGPQLDYQHPHGGSQLSVILIPGKLMPTHMQAKHQYT